MSVNGALGAGELPKGALSSHKTDAEPSLSRFPALQGHSSSALRRHSPTDELGIDKARFQPFTHSDAVIRR